MAFQQQINPMDYAKKAGRQRRIADVLQDLQLQQSALPGEMGDYSTKKTALDMGSGLISNLIMKGIQTALIPATGGASVAAPTILEKIFKMAGKGTAKSFLSEGISGGLGKLLNIKPPEAPKADMSKLTGPGMSGARQTIADALEVSDTGYKGRIEGFDKNRQLLNLLMSFGSELKQPFGEFTFRGKEYAGEEAPWDWMKNLIGCNKEGI